LHLPFSQVAFGFVGLGAGFNYVSGHDAGFAIQPRRIEEARSYLDRVAQQWDDALSRIRTFVEN